MATRKAQTTYYVFIVFSGKDDEGSPYTRTRIVETPVSHDKVTDFITHFTKEDISECDRFIRGQRLGTPGFSNEHVETVESRKCAAIFDSVKNECVWMDYRLMKEEASICIDEDDREWYYSYFHPMVMKKCGFSNPLGAKEGKK
jgi:hypothetical protein